MRLLPVAALLMTTCAVHAEPVHLDVEGAHVIVIRPMDSWNPNSQFAERSLASLRKKMFAFQYIDASGSNVTPREGGVIFSKISTPISELVFGEMAEKGWRPYVAITYHISAPVQVDPQLMPALRTAQNRLYRAAVVQQGDPAKLESKETLRATGAVLTTVAAAGFGVSKLGASAVNASQYTTLYDDFAKLAGAGRKAMLPLPLPEYDFSQFSSVEVRRVTDNAGNLGEIVIGYKEAKSTEVENRAFAKGISSMAGMDTTVAEVEATRHANYQWREAAWKECSQDATCPVQ
jgi:hypothetical protein